jgi:putative ATP-dependent endonuclease of OLD family
MIARADAANALLIRRFKERGTIAFPRIQDAVRSAIADAAHQAETLFTLTNSTRILFAEKVFLAEGKTEQTILPDLFFHEFSLSLDEDKTGLIALGSSNDVPNAMKVLSAMHIPTKAVVDIDFAFRLAAMNGLLAENDANILSCKTILKRLADGGQIALDADGLPMKGPVTAAKAFELLAIENDAIPVIKAIHDQLLTHNIWLWRRGTIESHLGLVSKKPAAHLAFLASYPTPAYRAALPDYVGIQAMLNWLKN